MEKKIHIHLGYFVIAFLLMFGFQYWMATRITETVPYSAFQSLLKEGKLADVVVSENIIVGMLKDPQPDGRKRVLARRVDPAFAKDLEGFGVTFSAATENTWIRDLASWIVPTLFFIGLWVFVIRRFASQGSSGLMSIGKSKAKVYVERDVRITFADVAGVDEAKKELEEVVSFLKDPTSYGRLGARMPRGILLVGPPGTGKTLMARAIAGEAGVPFFSINGSEFVEMFVGVGAARVRDLFQQAAEHAPCIVFIDELDALGRARGFGIVSGGNDEKEQTLNQLLVEMDGFDARSGVIFLAATNRPEILDPALLRAGRFDRQLVLDRPDKRGREAILKIHTTKIRLSPHVDLAAIAALTVGFSGADLANIANEAAMAATRRGASAVETSDFTMAFERIVAGPEKKNRALSPRERQVIAHHEMGHALVAFALPVPDEIHKISIIPRGIGALGYTLQRPAQERFIMTRGELADKIAVLLGGRAAEALVFDEISTGAGDDLVKATDLARSMVMQYGMCAETGEVVYEPPRPVFLEVKLEPGPRQYSEQTAREIDCAIRRLIDDGFARATTILTAHRAILDEGASLLLAQETLQDEALMKLKSKMQGPLVPSKVPELV